MAKTRAIKIRGKFPNLRNVPTEVLRKCMPRIVQRVTEQAQTEAPKWRGMTSPKSIVRRITGRVVSKGERGIVKAGAPHSHLMEYGVQPHSLAPGSGKRRKRRGFRAMLIYGDLEIMRRGAWHPGIKPNPFMERAVPNSQSDVNRILQQEGDRAFEEAVLTAVEDVAGWLD